VRAGVDVGAIERQMHERLTMLRELNEIRPLQIPDFANPDISTADPFAVIAGHFAEFCDELREQHRASSLVNDIETAAERALAFPEFTRPPPPKYVKKSVQSPDLVDLAAQLRGIAERTKEAVPFEAIQSLANTQRAALSFEPPNLSPVLEPDETPLFDDGEGEPESPALTAFRRAAIAKLPPDLAKRFESAALVPRIEEFECDDEDENAEPPFESNLEGRTAVLNSLLRTMASIDLPPSADDSGTIADDSRDRARRLAAADGCGRPGPQPGAPKRCADRG
jgi:hypothetical protein